MKEKYYHIAWLKVKYALYVFTFHNNTGISQVLVVKWGFHINTSNTN